MAANVSIKAQILVAAFMITAVLFIPTTIVLFVGLMPSIAARFIDKSKLRLKALTVGFMNFAGVFPFWYKMVEDGHSVEAAFEVISEPSSIVIMYTAAIVGYLIEWGVKGLVANISVQRGQKRVKDIEDLHAQMIERWGQEVTGQIPLDVYGFPLAQVPEKK
jgi:hypothetical protein